MEFRKKVSISGILIGSIVTVVGSYILTFVVGDYIDKLIMASGWQLPANFNQMVYINPLFFFIPSLVDLLFPVLGGYIAAYIAKHDELLNAALSAIPVMVLAICRIIYDFPILVILSLSLLLNPLLAILGGYLRLKLMSRKKVVPLGANIEIDLPLQEIQSDGPPVDQISKSKKRIRTQSEMIWLSVIVIGIGIGASVSLGWIVGSICVIPGVIFLLASVILSSTGKGIPRPTDETQE